MIKVACAAEARALASPSKESGSQKLDSSLLLGIQSPAVISVAERLMLSWAWNTRWGASPTCAGLLLGLALAPAPLCSQTPQPQPDGTSPAPPAMPSEQT